MNLITILEERVNIKHQENCYLHLLIQKELVSNNFSWLNCEIKGRVLECKGTLNIAKKKYPVIIYYSPFYTVRYDRIYICDKSIKYNDDIHLYYPDLELCLYHPKIDKPLFNIVPLIRIIPWISEWCVFYEEWKKYGVWLGKEIKHTPSNMSI